MWGFLRRGAVFGVFFVLVAEIFFRAVVPSSQPPFQAYNPQFGILHHEGCPARSGQFTSGRLARVRTRWNVNEAGWNSPREYIASTERDRPCVAVIGNSYVEGFYADVDSGLTGALERQLGSSSVVYNFGKSGVNAAQMLRVARYAKSEFAPETFVFVINHSSLRASIRDFGFQISNEQYAWKDSTFSLSPPTEYRPNRVMRLRTHSALVRYLYHNAAVLKTRAAIRQEAIQRNDPLASTKLADETPILAATARDVALRARSELPGARILFVMDSDRKRMYETRSRPEPLRESPLWETACREAGVEFVDMTDAFWDAFQADGRPLDRPDNYHWNQHGMTVVARKLADVMRTPMPSTAGL